MIRVVSSVTISGIRLDAKIDERQTSWDGDVLLDRHGWTYDEPIVKVITCVLADVLDIQNIVVTEEKVVAEEKKVTTLRFDMIYDAGAKGDQLLRNNTKLHIYKLLDRYIDVGQLKIHIGDEQLFQEPPKLSYNFSNVW